MLKSSENWKNGRVCYYVNELNYAQQETYVHTVPQYEGCYNWTLFVSGTIMFFLSDVSRSPQVSRPITQLSIVQKK